MWLSINQQVVEEMEVKWLDCCVIVKDMKSYILLIYYSTDISYAVGDACYFLNIIYIYI
jgi:hypothetical protein